MNLSTDIVLHIIVENIKLEADSSGVHLSKKLFIYKIISKKAYRGHNTVKNFDRYLLLNLRKL